LLACSANENLIIFEIRDEGRRLEKLLEVEVDRSFKNPTIVKYLLFIIPYVFTSYIKLLEWVVRIAM
jgi:hypothetical protein